MKTRATTKDEFKGGSTVIEQDNSIHPSLTNRRKAVEISRSSFEKVFNAIIEVLSEKKEMRFSDLHRAVAVKMHATLDNSIAIYTAAIKLYMEHQGIIERIPARDQQYIRLMQ